MQKQWMNWQNYKKMNFIQLTQPFQFYLLLLMKNKLSKASRRGEQGSIKQFYPFLINAYSKLFISQNNIFIMDSQVVKIILLILQMCLFFMGRLLDDMSWYDVGVANEVYVFEGIGVAGMTICVLLQILRKRDVEGMWKILFFRSQLKFIIPWALIITICILFFNIFGCTAHLPESQLGYFYVDYTGCCLNIVQIVLTNLNYSLITNTKAHTAELILYQAILFGEIIFNGDLLMLFINNLEAKPKDYSILLISIIIANQVLIMDLIFRAAYEDRERELEKEEKLIGHKVTHVFGSIMQDSKQPNSALIVDVNSTTNIQLSSPIKKP